MNYKKIALVICLVPSIMVGSDNKERIKELEEKVFTLSKYIKDLSADKDIADSLDDEDDSLHSVIEYNYKIMNYSGVIMGLFFSNLLRNQENSPGNCLYLFTTYIVISTFFVVLPIDCYVRSYLLKKVEVKKRRQR